MRSTPRDLFLQGAREIGNLSEHLPPFFARFAAGDVNLHHLLLGKEASRLGLRPHLAPVKSSPGHAKHGSLGKTLLERGVPQLVQKLLLQQGFIALDDIQGSKAFGQGRGEGRGGRGGGVGGVGDGHERWCWADQCTD